MERLKFNNIRSRKWVEIIMSVAGGGGAFVTLVFAKKEWQNWDGGRSVGNDRPVVKISCLFFDNAT